jgi:uncharacterized repeat protein (TIGR01451 family)
MHKSPRQRKDSRVFSALCEELFALGLNARFRANGRSMEPNIYDEDALVVAGASGAAAEPGDVAFTRGSEGLRAHRIVSLENGNVFTRGDSGLANDQLPGEFVGKVISIERGRRTICATGVRARLFQAARKGAHRVWRAGSRRASTPLICAIFFVLLVFFGVSPASAQTLTIGVTSNPTTLVAPLDTITYTISLSNTSGQRVNRNVTVSMPLPNAPSPPGTVYTSYSSATAVSNAGLQAWSCGFTAATETIACTDIDNYANGDRSTLTFVVTVLGTAPAGTVLTGTATAVGGNFAGASASDSVTVQIPTLTLTNTGAPTIVQPASNVTYTIALSNSSGVNAIANETVSMVDPPNTTFVSAARTSGTGTWTCTNSGAPLTATCTDTAAYNNGSATNFNFVFMVNSGTPNGTLISSTATASAANTASPASATSNNSTVQGPVLTVSNSGAPNPIAPGDTLTYTVGLSNASGSTVTANETVTMAVPANTTFVSAGKTSGTGTWTCANNAGIVTCTDTANYASGGATTFGFVFTVNTGTTNGTVISSNAIAQGLNTGGSGAASANVTVQTPDISVTNTPNPTPQVATGGAITYTQVLTNNGSEEAVGASFTETTPTNTTFTSATPPANWTCGTLPAAGGTGTITCTANSGTTVAAAGTATLTVVVTVNSGANIAGATIADTVTVSETGTDPNPANNTATATVTVISADLSMTQSVSATAVAPGNTITYTETVTNSGPQAATNVTLYQQTPPNTTFASMTPPTGWSCATEPAVGATGQVICTIATLASGTTSTNFTFTSTVNSGANAPAAGTTIQNYADVTSQTSDPNPSNNATITSILVETTGDADLGVTGSASPTPVFTSSTLIYTLQVADYGLAASSGTTLTDALPSGVTYVTSSSTQGTCSQASGTVTCNLGSVAFAPSSPVTITITVTTPTTATTLTNSASVSSTGSTDPVSSNNSVSIVTVVQPLVCATPGKDGSPGSPLSGVVNAYYSPANTGTVTAGSISITLGHAAANGAQTAIAVGDLLLIIQMQDAQINAANTTSYGSGIPGQPSGSTSLGSSGMFEFVTATSAVPVTGGTLSFKGSGQVLTGNAVSGLLNSYTYAAAATTQGAQTFQVIRVPQYTSVTLSSALTAMSWNGATGGVLALDVSSQLTLGGTVVLDGLGFRGGGGIDLRGQAGGAATDTMTLSPTNLPALPPPGGSGANASKGEGIAGTPHWVAPALSTITITTTATNTGQTYLEGFPNGSFARGAPGNGGGGATDANPANNDQNSGGGGGANGGAGGSGGYAWNSAGLVGGYGGTAFPATTSYLVMGGGGGAGTNNDGAYWNPSTNSGAADCGANCTGIYSSGTAGGGIVVIRAGTVVGTGTITSNGQTALELENDGGGGGGAGGSLLIFANSGGLGGLTLSAVGGGGGDTWPEQTPGATFPGNRHGPGGGGGGGVALLTGAPASLSLSGGIPGYSTLADDAYGATPGGSGTSNAGLTITQTPGTQSGAYCAGADLAVTDVASPTIVVPGNTITYTQTITNNGPFDALNAVFSQAVPENTVITGVTPSGSTGWICNTTTSITCSNPDFPSGAMTTFTVTAAVNSSTPSGTEIVDTVSATSGTNDPVLSNNSATATVLVAAANTADLTVTQTAVPNPVAAGGSITYAIKVTNNGPATATNVTLSEAIPSAAPIYATYSSSTCASGWTCTHPALNGTGTLTAQIASLASGGTATFTLVLNVSNTTPSGTVISETANVSSSVTDPNPGSNSATTNVTVASPGQFDLAVTDSASPNPVLPANNITYTQTLTNNGPASASSVVFSGSVPANTTLVFFTIPTGWICTALPAAGGTGTITCCPGSGATCSGTFGVGAPVSFPMVVQVNAATAPGTTISNTVSVAPTTNDVTPSNNTATSTTVVASPSQADVSIVKTASPQPVDQGTNLTYMLQITNDGPAIAQGVTVTDPLPTQVTFTDVSTTQGTCPTTGSTVVCNIGSMSVGSVVTITIDVQAATYTSMTNATNTATVSSTTSDPNLSNNTSSVTSTIEAPTAVQLSDFHATMQPQGGVVIEWHTKEEVRNLGFHLYREDSTGRHRLDPSLIAGSALVLRGGRPQHAAKTYQWIDTAGDAQSSYSIEDVDLNGTRTMHGPVQADAASGASASAFSEGNRAPLLSEINRFAAAAVPNASARHLTAAHPRPVVWPQPVAPVATPTVSSGTLNGEPAVKISVSQEGWYRLTAAQLFAAGLSDRSNPRLLQLYAEGVEQPMIASSPSSFWLSPSGSIEFYGTGIDTPFSGTRVYWLVNGSHAGLRIGQINAEAAGQPTATSFSATTILEQRTTYFAALLNGENNDNFFGAVISTDPVDQALAVAHSDPTSSIPVTLDLTLQGATDLQPHSVSVSFNGTYIGEMDFANLTNPTNTLVVPTNLLEDGTDTVTLTALNGDNDISLVQSIALHYPHKYIADANWLRAAAPPGASLRIGGFANAQIQVFDITDPVSIEQLTGRITFDGSGYGISVSAPIGARTDRTLLAFSADQIGAPDALTYHAPNNLDDAQYGASYVVITHPEYAASVVPLVNLHQQEGESTLVATTDEIFDAYSYGERSPFALRSFLQNAATRWRVAPQAVLLMGDASLDPRNYLGFGDLDFVPTRIIETQAFKTASDDWLTDFKQTGFATIPTGRIPADTPDEAALAISKIVNYERGASAGPWQEQATVVADQNAGDNFSAAAQTASTLLPPGLVVTKIFADGEEPALAEQQIVDAINSGTLLVDYSGHGAEDQWSFSDIFDSSTASTLANGDRLPVFILMDCLNGFFQDVYSTSLAESLIFAPNGGAVAVWASSGFTEEPPQATMNQALLTALRQNPQMPLGQAILLAKQGITDQDVRRTWTLFGDPAMRIPQPAMPQKTGRIKPQGTALLH